MERKYLTSRRLLARFLLAAVLLVIGQGQPSAQEASQAASPVPVPSLAGASFDYARDPNAVVVQYSRIPEQLQQEHQTPHLRIYGDGLVLVHYPEGMKKAGDYRLQLTPQEMDQLVGSLVADGVAEFDANQARRAKKEARRQRRASTGIEMLVADDDTSSIELNLAAYRPALSNTAEQLQVPITPIQQRIVWRGLRTDARHYPHIDSINRLAAAEQRLLALTRRDDLELIAHPREVQ
jgi:hypothetical protein